MEKRLPDGQKSFYSVCQIDLSLSECKYTNCCRPRKTGTDETTDHRPWTTDAKTKIARLRTPLARFGGPSVHHQTAARHREIR